MCSGKPSPAVRRSGRPRTSRHPSQPSRRTDSRTAPGATTSTTYWTATRNKAFGNHRSWTRSSTDASSRSTVHVRCKSLRHTAGCSAAPGLQCSTRLRSACVSWLWRPAANRWCTSNLREKTIQSMEYTTTTVAALQGFRTNPTRSALVKTGERERGKGVGYSKYSEFVYRWVRILWTAYELQ